MWWRLLHSSVRWAALGALVAVSVAVGLIQYGKSTERAEDAAREAQDYIETRQDMDNADIGTGDADIDLDWLRGAAERLHGPR